MVRRNKPKPSLQGPLAKVARAQVHLDDLKRELLPINGYRAYPFVGEIHRDGRDHLFRAGPNAPVVNPDWALLIGDVLHNLRSALDHLAWQLVLAHSGNPNMGTQFPIHPSDGRRNPCTGLIEPRPCEVSGGVDPGALQIIKDVQPYKATMDGVYLRRIHDGDNIDKHRHLLVAVSTPAWWGGPVDRAGPKVVGQWRSRKSLKPGDPAVRLTYSPALANLDPHFAIGADVFFDDGMGSLAYLPAGPILRELVEFLRNDLFPRFAPFV